MNKNFQSKLKKISFFLISIIFTATYFISTNVYAASNSKINSKDNIKSFNYSLAPMVKKAMPSIVAISGIKHIKDSGYPDNYPHSKNNPEREIASQLKPRIAVFIGSGVIVDAAKGYIITNAHVVTDLDEIKVTLNDKRLLDANVIGIDKPTDLALIQIEAKNLNAIKFANSDKLNVGDFVVAIGNPFGFQQSVSSGIISALGRTDIGFEGFFDLIQTDAAINMGNSGGGLLNLNGELIGINTAIITPPSNRGNIGLGFAIPSNMTKKILAQLANVGHVDRGIFGVHVQAIDENLATAFGLPKNQGAIVTNIIPQSPADKAKLLIGDVILAVNNKEIQDPLHLRTLISVHPPGSKTNITVCRDKKIIKLPIEIINPKENFTKGELIAKNLKGAWLEATTPNTADFPGIRVIEIDPKSPASKTSLESGDIIVNANKHKVANIDELKKATDKEKSFLIMQIIRDKNSFFVAVSK